MDEENSQQNEECFRNTKGCWCVGLRMAAEVTTYLGIRKFGDLLWRIIVSYCKDEDDTFKCINCSGMTVLDHMVMGC